MTTASGAGPAAAAGALAVAACAPYLARLTLSVPDRATEAWWRGAPAQRRRTAVVAAAGAVLGALAGAAAGWTAALPALIALAIVGTPLAVVDVEHHRLPNRLVGLAAAAGATLFASAAAATSAWPSLLRVAEAAAAVFAALFLLVLAAPRSFGFGDVKLGGVLGGYLGWFGWTRVLDGVFTGFLFGALAAAALVVARRATLKTHVPFGPALLLGTLVELALPVALPWAPSFAS